MPKENSTSRVCIRLPCELPAEIHFEGGDNSISKRAIISNISTTGLQILSPSFVATGQALTATFQIPGQFTKSKIRAEVMRVESLQGRMIGHFPYALGARFADNASRHEKMISRFITKKLSFSRWRKYLALVLFFLSGAQISWSYLSQKLELTQITDVYTLAYPLELAVQALFHLWVNFSLGIGLATAAILCLFNHRRLVSQAKFWLGAEIILSISQIACVFFWIQGQPIEQNLLFAKAGIILAAAGTLFSFFRLAERIQETERKLTSEKISPASGRPTFTII